MKTSTSVVVVAALLAAGSAVAKDENGLSQADQSFLQGAAMGDLAEVRLGALAAAKGSTPELREFGRWMISTHGFASRELSTITQRLHGATPPLKLDAKSEAAMHKLQALDGKAFDAAYLQAMEEDHEADLKKAEAEAKGGQDYLVKTFAANLAPAVQEHLAQIKLLKAAMNGGDAGDAAANANMQAPVGGMSGPAKGNTPQARQIERQHSQP